MADTDNTVLSGPAASNLGVEYVISFRFSGSGMAKSVRDAVGG